MKTLGFFTSASLIVSSSVNAGILQTPVVSPPAVTFGHADVMYHISTPSPGTSTGYTVASLAYTISANSDSEGDRRGSSEIDTKWSASENMSFTGPLTSLLTLNGETTASWSGREGGGTVTFSVYGYYGDGNQHDGPLFTTTFGTSGAWGSHQIDWSGVTGYSTSGAGSVHPLLLFSTVQWVGAGNGSSLSFGSDYALNSGSTLGILGTDPSPVPEPSTVISALIAAGGIGLHTLRGKRRARISA